MSLKKKHTRELLKMLERTRRIDSLNQFLYIEYTTAEIKAELATREHIPNKEEAKLLRQKQAKAKKNR